MQPHIWFYSVIGIIQPEDLVQVFSVPFNVRYYWVNSLNIAIKRIPKYGDMSGTTECPNL